MSNNILIVDDSEVDRKIMSKIISSNFKEAAIFESSDGRNIVELIKTHNIKACILDLKMPDVDGVQLLSEIKTHPDTQDVPVIVCSGVIDTPTLERVLKLGAYDYLYKPLSDEAMKISLPIKVRNAVELMNRTRHIIHMSKVDSLTGLYNRDYFKNYLDEIKLDQIIFPTSLLMCDINGLKVLNDAYGNHWGDWYLKEVANTISTCLPTNAICARWGGDEFAILLSNTNKNTTEELCIKIKKQVDKINHHGLHLSVSFGSDTLLEKSGDFSKLINNAEDAMFRDKILEDVSVRSNMIATIIQTLNEKNPREEAHSRRVSELCEKMGMALKLNEKDIRELKVIGLLHDIGKIAIDEHILNKPGKLTDEEYLEIKRHPEIGCRILSTSKEMRNYMDVILAHHERMDGGGYPNGLVGDNIPYLARILSISDSFDAMTCERPYKKQRTTLDAAMELIKCSGSQFDSFLVDTFVTKVLGLVTVSHS